MISLGNLFAQQARRMVMVAGLSAVGFAAVAVIMAARLNLNACHLCIFQRIVYLFIGLTLLLAAATWHIKFFHYFLRQISLALATMFALWGMFVATKQSFLQWFQYEKMSCDAAGIGITEQLIDHLGRFYPQLFMATGACSDKDFVLIGLSLANWSFLILLAFFAYSVLALLFSPKR